MEKEKSPGKGKPLTRQCFLEKGFKLFSRKNIGSVSLEEIAKESGHGIATLYRYFGSKSHFVLEVASFKWGEFFKENRKRRPVPDFEGITSAQMFAFYLDTFLELYKNNRDLLRFNQMLNIYIRSGEADENIGERYQTLLKPINVYFHNMYEKGKLDGTIRTDVSEDEMFSVTIHLMLAVVTRYAVGLVYEPDGFDALKELEIQKEMLFLKYTT